MNKNDELSRLWRLICACDRELSSAAREFARTQVMSEHYRKLKADMVKLKAEYEKLKGGGSYNPMSYEHGDRHTARNMIGRRTGKTGADTHHRLED